MHVVAAKLTQLAFRMVNFVKCDITQWKDQVALFKQCLSTSKSNTIDLVIANAGIAGSDPVYQNSGVGLDQLCVGFVKGATRLT